MSAFRQYIDGYLQIELTGYGKERFLNLCLNKEFTLWELSKDQEHYTFYISLKEFREIKPLLKKTETRVHILKKCGLPFFFYTHRKQKCFVLGLLLCIGFVYYMSLFIWDIHVEGSAYYTEDEIINYIQSTYITPGTKIKDINRDDLEQKLMEYFDEIAWISCEIRGTQLLVTMTETIVSDQVIVSDEPSDLVAAKDCEIVSLITRNGTPVTKVNQEVKKGEILISGAINIYDDNNEVLETDYVAADGDVFGRVSYDYKDEFEMAYYEKEFTGKKKSSFSLYIMNKIYQLWKPAIDYKYYDTRYDSYMEKLGATFYLPFSIQATKYLEYQPVRKEYTKDEAKEKARNALNRKVKELSEKGVEILENNVKIEIKDGKCMASGTLICVERIGVPMEIHIPLEEKKSEE